MLKEDKKINQSNMQMYKILWDTNFQERKIIIIEKILLLCRYTLLLCRVD